MERRDRGRGRRGADPRTGGRPSRRGGGDRWYRDRNRHQPVWCPADRGSGKPRGCDREGDRGVLARGSPGPPAARSDSADRGGQRGRGRVRMIRLGSLAGYPFEGPRLLAGWTPPASAAVYAIAYKPEPEAKPDKYAVIYVGH